MTTHLAQDATVAWEIALDRLEVDLVLAERLLHTLQSPADLSAWEQPPLASPLPDQLVPRAQRLALRQQHLLESLSVAMDQSRRQRDLANRVGQATTGPVRPVYIDATA